MQLTRYQEAPGVKKKIEYTLARLGRFKTESYTVGDEDESKRGMILFECVQFVQRGWASD